MQIRDSITPSVLSAAAGLLAPYCPDLTPTALVKAIKAYQSTAGTADPTGLAARPLTRRQVAETLGISLQSVSRMMNDGRLRRIVLSAKSVRIDADSLRALLAGNATTADDESEG